MRAEEPCYNSPGIPGGKMNEIKLTTHAREELVDITSQIRSFLSSVKAGSGVLTVFVPHTTAAVTINENADPDVACDIVNFTSKLIPQDSGFAHSEGNADAHIKSSLVSPSMA